MAAEVSGKVLVEATHKLLGTKEDLHAGWNKRLDADMAAATKHGRKVLIHVCA